MARGRFISRAIITDRAISNLSNDTCKLAFTWLITMADREGRTVGEPELLVASLFPRRGDVTPEVMEGFINEWVAAGFVVWYLGSDNDRYLQFVNFGKHQVGLRKEREPQSDYEAPEDCTVIAGCLPDVCRQSAAEMRVNVNDNVNDNVNPNVNVNKKPVVARARAKTTATAGVDSDSTTNSLTSRNIFTIWEEELCGSLTPNTVELLNLYKTEYSEAWLIEAVELAVKANVRKMSYVEAILKRWKADGKDNGTKPAGSRVTKANNEKSRDKFRALYQEQKKQEMK